MSAHLVSLKHVQALVTYAKAHRLVVGEAHDVGAALWKENVRSLRALYGERAANYWPTSPIVGQLYAHEPVAVDGVTLVKQCHCFDYQACETSDYRSTPAAKLVEAIREHALASLGVTDEELRRSTAYNNAPWGLGD